MAEVYPNTVQTVSIDATGEVLRYHLGETAQSARRVDLNINGDETADYSVDVGAKDSGDASVTWFNDHSTYSTATVRDGWDHSEEWLRLRITTAAVTAGSEARVYLSQAKYE